MKGSGQRRANHCRTEGVRSRRKEVAVGVLGEVESVVGAADGGLEVAKQRVDGLELR